MLLSLHWETSKKKIGKHHPNLTPSTFRAVTKKLRSLRVRGQTFVFLQGQKAIRSPLGISAPTPYFSFCIFPAKEYINCLTSQSSWKSKMSERRDKSNLFIMSSHIMVHLQGFKQMLTIMGIKHILIALGCGLRLDNTPSRSSLDWELQQDMDHVSSLWHPHFLAGHLAQGLLLNVCWIH